MRQDLKIIDTRCIKSFAAVGGTACVPAGLYSKIKNPNQLLEVSILNIIWFKPYSFSRFLWRI